MGENALFLWAQDSKWEWFSTKKNVKKSLTFFENCASENWQAWLRGLKLRSNFKPRLFKKPKKPNENDSHLARRF